MGLHAGAKEMVAAADHHHHAPGRRSSDPGADLGARSLHLHDLLSGPAARRSDARRSDGERMRKPLKVFSTALGLAVLLVACGEKSGASSRGSGAGKAGVSKAADDIPSSNRTGFYVD